jgi:hypothetical protein
MDTIWRYNTNGGGINSSIVVIEDNEPKILVSDMQGKITILNPYGVEIGQIFARGGIEGTCLFHTDESLNKYLIISSLEGYLKCVKFNK